jgi:hypothetical protein
MCHRVTGAAALRSAMSLRPAAIVCLLGLRARPGAGTGCRGR